jgi:aldose sugar dehydrogenase
MKATSLLVCSALVLGAGAALLACGGNGGDAAVAAGNAPTPAPTPAPAQPPASPPPTAQAVAPTLTREVLDVPGGLSAPWDLAFLPDGSMLITEKCSGLSVLRDGTRTRLFGAAGSQTVAPDFFCQGQSGMLGVAVDPEFGGGNRYVYVFMASNASSPRRNRVVRLTLAADLKSVGDRTDIVDDIAFKDVGNAVGGAGAHSGGRIRFGVAAGDRHLYVGTGDNHSAPLPQSPAAPLGGKVLRVTRDGSAAPGNNAPAGFDARIFTYGHRNVQGIAFRPGSGQPFIAEHGPNHSDEVTALVAGGNGGWDPGNRANLTCPDGYCGYAGNATTMPMTDTARVPAAMPPSWSNNGLSQGMGPATFLSGAQWKAWDGRLAVGIMAGQRIEILTLDSAGLATANTTATATNASLAARIRSLVQGPDGNLYVLTDSNQLWRIVPG